MTSPMPRDEIVDSLKLVAEWLRVKHPTKQFEIVVVGGSAMALLGMPRTTTDVDVLVPARLPQEIVEAARFVANAKGLGVDWINANAAAAVAVSYAEEERPAYFQERSLNISIATNLTVHVIGRQALISMKLLAASPSERKHIEDLRALNPTVTELEVAEQFVKSADSSAPRLEDLQFVLEELSKTK